MNGWITLSYKKKDGSPASAKEILATAYNGWLDEKDWQEARKISADPNFTEEQAQAHVKKLEDWINTSYGIWRQSL